MTKVTRNILIGLGVYFVTIFGISYLNAKDTGIRVTKYPEPEDGTEPIIINKKPMSSIEKMAKALMDYIDNIDSETFKVLYLKDKNVFTIDKIESFLKSETGYSHLINFMSMNQVIKLMVLTI